MFIMNNKPNCFRVYYSKMQGNNYAGGMVDMVSTITELHQCSRFKNIQKVVPLYIEESEQEVLQEDIIKAIDSFKAYEKERLRLSDIEALEARLKRLKE